MIETRFRVEPADWQVDNKHLRQIREAVFIEEQGVSEDEEWDNEDPISRHVVALDRKDRPVGTARLTPAGYIGRMAVDAKWRGRGVGAALLQCLMDLARNLGLRELTLHAQTHALPFYERFGFQATGGEFDECGIQHRKMTRKIKPFAPRTDAGVAPPLPSELIAVDGSDQVVDAIRALIGDAHLTVDVYTRNLDPRVLGQVSVMTALRDFLVGHARRRARFLVQDPAHAVTYGHLLFELSQRLPSRCLIRRVSKDYLDYHSAFVVADSSGFLFREFGERFDGTWNRNDAFRARELTRYFDEVWAHSLEDPNLRRLNIS